MTPILCCLPPSMIEAVWKFFGCYFCCSVDSFCDWFVNDWLFLDESCFKLSISSCRCLICLLNPYSFVWFVKESDSHGGFLLLFLMFSAFSCLIVVLCWVVVDILVLLDFLSMLVLLRLRFNMSELVLVFLCLYFKLLYFLNFRYCKTFLGESSFAFISVCLAWYWLWFAILFRELSVIL